MIKEFNEQMEDIEVYFIQCCYMTKSENTRFYRVYISRNKDHVEEVTMRVARACDLHYCADKNGIRLYGYGFSGHQEIFEFIERISNRQNLRYVRL